MSNRTITILLALMMIFLATCFNISPTPNIVLLKPSYRSWQRQDKSSYFGYSVNLRKSSIIIGAPRAESPLESQRKIKEPGAVFTCSLAGIDQNCLPFNVDEEGDVRVEKIYESYDSKKKSLQMLGAAMDGSEFEKDRFVVCAPMMRSFDSDMEDEAENFFVHGICYWVGHTANASNMNPKSIAPLRSVVNQIVTEKNLSYYAFGESGFSVHVTDDNEEIIVGCPGIFYWQGSVARHSAHQLDPFAFIKQNKITSQVATPLNKSDDAYFGYAVSSGRFLSPESKELFYVASAPRAPSTTVTGEVYIFDIVFSKTNEFSHTSSDPSNHVMKVYHTFTGHQIGEYFGYSILTEDFNNDQMPDLAVSAPLHSSNGFNETGAVYIYINQGNVSDKFEPFTFALI